MHFPGVFLCRYFRLLNLVFDGHIEYITVLYIRRRAKDVSSHSDRSRRFFVKIQGHRG